MSHILIAVLVGIVWIDLSRQLRGIREYLELQAEEAAAKKAEERDEN